VLSAAGGVAIKHGSPELAQEYLRRVTAMSQADYSDWTRRLDAAYKLKDEADSITTLTVLMQRWPDRATKLNPDGILWIADDATRLHNGGSLSLLKALYDAHWKLEWDIEPSKIWWDLSLRLIQDNRLAEASEVSNHVTDVYVLIAMRPDRRFDAVLAANSELFDIEAATQRELQTYQILADKSPHDLGNLYCSMGARRMHCRPSQAWRRPPARMEQWYWSPYEWMPPPNWEIRNRYGARCNTSAAIDRMHPSFMSSI
jgi:hypothetical protein